MIKLVLTDLDDTLIPFGTPCATPRALAAIHALQDAGVHFAPCSGRPAEFLHDMFAGDDGAWSTAVLVNGQEIRLDGAIVFQKALDYGALAELSRFALGFPNTGLIVMIGGHEVAIGVSERTICEHPEVFVSDPPTIPELPEGDYVKAIMYVGGGQDQVARVRDLCAERFPMFGFALPTAGEPVIDVMPLGWSKADGADRLREILGLSRDEVCVFGDAANDVPILRAYPNSVAVANATSEARAAARNHIGACADDAVADALFQIAEAAHAGSLPAFMQ